MVANQFLAVLIVLMIARDGSLAVRHRRPFRFALLAFWVLLLAAQITNRTIFYPAVATCWVVAMWLKMREVSHLTEKLKGAGKLGSSTKVPSLWDREIDGHWAGER
jgi:hypothetical protein